MIEFICFDEGELSLEFAEDKSIRSISIFVSKQKRMP
jgi:hypothetical protein